ncbi:unannotated protein [freshwater metagenome]|uniref:Unannotated protein n=1 Tax=freshwater metagenome TaxID=449393 RepID=A0A6J6XJ01_9ZZZZ
MATAWRHTCAVLVNGEVKCWGRNTVGQLGNASNTGSNIPVAVSGIATGITVAARDQHSCSLLEDQSVVCWGSNGSGELGDGTTTNSNIPVTVIGL